MKLRGALVFYATGVFLFASALCRAAEPLSQINASVEIYELPPAKAAAWQQTFENSSESDRQKLVAQFRAGAVDEAKIIGFGQRVCALGKPSTVATVEQYRYPTQFETKDGISVPTSFEITNVGCTMTLEVTLRQDGDSFDVTTNIRDVALLSTQHYAASKGDQPGSIEQPVFATQTIATNFRIDPGLPKLVSVYLPHKVDRSAAVMRLVFVTVRADR